MKQRARTVKGMAQARKPMMVSIANPNAADLNEKITGEQERIARASNYINRFFASSGEAIYAPMDDLANLSDSVATNGILQCCNRFKAAAVARLGHRLESSPYNSGTPNETERGKLEEWIREKFYPSMSEVGYRAHCDKYDFGMGLIRIDENLVEVKRDGKVIGREISRISHLNRLHAQPLKPRKVKRSIQIPNQSGGVAITRTEIEVDDPADVRFPRWIINAGDNQIRYAKTYGDPRFINKYTGHTQDKTWGVDQGELMDGCSIIALRQYDARDENCGWPIWYAEKQSVDVSWEIGRYEWGHFRGNCLPNLLCVFPEAKVAGGRTLPDVVQQWLRDTAEQREHGGDHRKALTIEIPIKSLSTFQGKLPIEVHEIKGPDPDKFLEMNKHKGQRIANSCQMPPSLVHADTGTLGSGSDKEADLKRLKELILEPEQNEYETQCLDRIILNGTEFKSFVIRLQELDTSNPKQTAEIAEIWSRVPQKISEFRTRIEATEAIDPESEERSKKLGQIWMFGTQGLMSLDDLEAVTEAAIEEEQQPAVPEEKDPPKPTDGKRFAEYLRTVLNVTPEQFRDQVLPVLQERICQQN